MEDHPLKIVLCEADVSIGFVNISQCVIGSFVAEGVSSAAAVLTYIHGF